MIADDGARRGDGAPVLVLHTTHERARAHLDDPDAAIAPALTAARRLLPITGEPEWTHAHRWTFAKPAGTHGDAPYWWDGRSRVRRFVVSERRAARRIGVAVRTPPRYGDRTAF